MGLLYATYTGYFKSAKDQLSKGISFGLRVLPYGLAIAFAISVFLLIVAEFLPLILGKKFSNSVFLVQLLCIFPLLRVITGVGSDILRGLNLQALRVSFMIASTILVVPACWIGVKLAALNGAVLAVLTVHALTAISIWVAVFYRSARLTLSEQSTV